MARQRGRQRTYSRVTYSSWNAFNDYSVPLHREKILDKAFTESFHSRFESLHREFSGVQSGRRDTQVCVGRVETTTATVEGQKPSSGCSFIGDRAGFTRQRTGGPCRAMHETPTCSAARVRPGPGMHAVDVADPADGQRPGWVAGFGTDGFSTRTRV